MAKTKKLPIEEPEEESEDALTDEPEAEEAQDDEADEAAEEMLAKKYAEQTRQIFPQKIELPVSTIVTMVETQINLSPDFQRRDVWDVKKQSKFIESLIMNVPVPPVFMGEDSYGKYAVLDGRQRLTAIVRFMKNEYALTGLRVWSELNKARYSDLVNKKLDVSLLRRFLPAVVLLKESSAEIKYDVFERLNTGGLNLQAMEIRNAVFRGGFTDLLHECSRNKTFCALWGIPSGQKARAVDPTVKRMRDLELVLRFFALTDAQAKPEEKRSAFKTYLGRFMELRNEQFRLHPKLAAKDLQDFESAVTNCHALLGPNAFRNVKGKRSAPLADALMYAMMQVTPKQRAKDAVVQSVKQARDKLLKDKKFQDTLDQGTNGRAKIELRLSMAHSAVRKALETAEQ